MRDHGKEPIWRTHAEVEPTTGPVQVTSTEKSASIVPLLILHRQAWDLAQTDGVLLERLEYAAEALALSRAIAVLVEEVADEAARVRWAVKVSEAEHLLIVVHDALADHEEGCL